MPTVFDVAAFVLERLGTMKPMKLQKLTFYGQAWSLVRDNEALFPQHFEAWRHGPVCPALYAKHARAEAVCPPFGYGEVGALDEKNVTTLEAVLAAYGGKPSGWLSDMTHREAPWLNARGNLPLEANSDAVITLDAMRAYYSCASSREQKIVMTFGQKNNALISFMQDMTEADGLLLDELSDLDLTPEVAKLTLS